MLSKISEIPGDDLNRNSKHLASLFGMKSAAQYGENLITEKDARTTMSHLARFRQWALEKVPKK